ncbi:NAD(P)/FAD-dependent oxidoreductase [Candidatus Margulisiibacteriota bacterium]
MKQFDLCIIGGGPAGLMAAAIASERGKSVVLLEKNDSCGKKLLITGKGRCNITHLESDTRRFTEAFGKNGKFLFSPLSQFSIQDTIKFFNDRGLETKLERGRRVFPVSDKAKDILELFLDILKKQKEKIIYNAKIKEIVKSSSSIEKIKLADSEIKAKSYLIATGGLSYPETGSTGDGYKYAKKLGHTIVETKPALTPIKVKEKWIAELMGLSLKNVSISIYQNNKKRGEKFGEALFTHRGLSGPIVLDLSNIVRDLITVGPVEIRIDFKPALDYQKLDQRIQRDFNEHPKAIYKNILSRLLPTKLIPIIIKLSGIVYDKKVNLITKEERKKLLHLLKEFKLTATGIIGYDKAVVTAGGICLKEVDSKTMQSKIIDNLYFAGEILDLDGSTGGFNLQVCWSTGYVAGKNA